MRGARGDPSRAGPEAGHCGQSSVVAGRMEQGPTPAFCGEAGMSVLCQATPTEQQRPSVGSATLSGVGSLWLRVPVPVAPRLCWFQAGDPEARCWSQQLLDSRPERTRPVRVTPFFHPVFCSKLIRFKRPLIHLSVCLTLPRLDVPCNNYELAC